MPVSFCLSQRIHLVAFKNFQSSNICVLCEVELWGGNQEVNCSLEEFLAVAFCIVLKEKTLGILGNERMEPEYRN